MEGFENQISFQETQQIQSDEELELKSMMRDLSLNFQAKTEISKKKIKKIKLNLTTNNIIQRRKTSTNEAKRKI